MKDLHDDSLHFGQKKKKILFSIFFFTWMNLRFNLMLIGLHELNSLPVIALKVY